MSIRITEIESADGFQAIDEQWRSLCAKAANNPFVSADWMAIWLDCFGAGTDIRIILAWREDELVGALPLQGAPRTLSRFFAKEWRFAGDGMMADYSGILAKNGDETVIRPLIAAALDSGWSMLRLSRLSERSGDWERLRDAVTGTAYRLEGWEESRSPYVPTNSDWDSYYGQLKKKLRQEIRTAHNKLNGDEFRFFFHDPEPDRALETLERFHRLRQTAKVGASIFEDLRREAFCKRLLSPAKGESGLQGRLSTLYVGENIISAVMLLEHQNSVYYWIPSFDPDAAIYSPGKVHLYYLLRHCFDAGRDQVDLLIGEERYKTQWSAGSTVNESCFISRSSALFALYKFKGSARNTLRALKENNSILSGLWIRLSKLQS